jgi:hypothetical protein
MLCALWLQACSAGKSRLFLSVAPLFLMQMPLITVQFPGFRRPFLWNADASPDHLSGLEHLGWEEQDFLARLIYYPFIPNGSAGWWDASWGPTLYSVSGAERGSPPWQAGGGRNSRAFLGTEWCTACCRRVLFVSICMKMATSTW